MTTALRSIARYLGLPPGALRSDLPERFGIPSPVAPDPSRHWQRVLRRSRDVLADLPPITGPRIAFITTIGKGVNNPGYAAVMAHAVRLRGAEPFFVYCDAWLEGCELPSLVSMSADHFIQRGPRPLCDDCFRPGMRLYEATGIESYPLSSFLDASALDEVSAFVEALPPTEYYRFSYKGMPLGPQVDATVTRFTFTNVAGNDEATLRLARRYVHGAAMMAEAMIRMDAALRPDVFAPQYGSYASRGTAVEAARALGRRCVVWFRGYVLEALMFGEGDNAFIEIAARTRGPWNDLRLTRSQEEKVDDLLGQRRTGAFRVMNRDALESEDALLQELRLDRWKPIVALYTNVGFDTKLFYDTPLYPDVNAWIFDTIESLRGREEQLVIRIHPGETWLPIIDKEQTVKAIRDRFPILPQNVRVIPPDSKLSSYTLARLSKAVLVYGSMIGLELAAQGKAVIVAGRGPYWRKGFTFDVGSREDLRSFLGRIDEIGAPDPERVAAARRFAYYFYAMRQIPFAAWNHDLRPGLRLRPWWKAFRSLRDLQPGRDPNLDAICDQLILGREALAADGEGLGLPRSSGE